MNLILWCTVAVLSAASPPPARATADAGVALPSASPSSAPATVDGGSPREPLAAPALATTRIADGDRLMQDRRYRDAAFAYQDASNAAPDNIEALFKLGNAYAVLGYHDQAISRWTRVLTLTDDAAIRRSANDNIARAEAKKADTGGSPQASGMRPGAGPVSDATRERARAAYEAGVKQIAEKDFAAALQSLTTAIELEPTLTAAFVARGSANIGLRRYEEAGVDYRYALLLDPASASPLYGLAEAYRGAGRVAEARVLYAQYAASTAKDVRKPLQDAARRKAELLGAAR